MGFHQHTFSKLNTEFNSNLTHAISELFQQWKGSSEARNFDVINDLQHIFEKWVEHCKKSTSKERLSPHLHKVPSWSNKVSPQTLQMALVVTCCSI
jgi:hypothetical protein